MSNARAVAVVMRLSQVRFGGRTKQAPVPFEANVAAVGRVSAD